MHSVKIGDIFAKCLPDNRYGLLRVVNKVEKDWQKKKYGQNALMFTVCQIIFQNLPTVDELSPEKNLYLNNLNGKEQYVLSFFSEEAIPSDLIYVGNVPLSAAEKKRFQSALITSSLSGDYWKKYTQPVANKIGQVQLMQYDRAGLKNLIQKDPCNVVNMDETLKNNVRTILHNGVKEILNLADTPSPDSVKDILKNCIIKLNVLNKEHNGFIETLEREKILLYIEDVCRCSAINEFDDKDREW